MGVKVTVNKQELHPQGDYVVAVLGNELSKKDPGKIKVKFVIADGPLAGRPLSRTFNAVVSPQSHLGGLLAACGVPVQNAQAGQQLDLDIINNVRVIATLKHHPMQNGSINSLENFRPYGGGTQAQPAPAQAFAPAPAAYTPAPAPVAAPAPVPTPAPAAAPAPALGPKISF